MGVPVTQTGLFGRAVCLLAVIPVIGCQDPGKPIDAVSPPEPGEHLVAGAAHEVELIAQTAVLGFRNDAGVLRAGYATHDVAVQDAVAELTPYHYANGERTTGGKIALETGAIQREDGTLLGGPSTTSTNSRGAVEIARGTVVEVLTNREDGIEQAWRFDAAPEGTGDLTVEVQVSGQSFVSATDSGLHFRSSAGLGFRYSHAVWLDAAGRDWPVQSAWKDGRISITVPSDILAETRFPAVLDPTVTAEIDVDAVVAGSTGQSSTSPAIAFDGTNYLVVWADQRLSRDEDIFATRVSQSGAILDPLGIAISTAAGRQIRPTVAFANGTYVVAWEDYKVHNGAEADIAAATVSTGGAVTSLGAVAPSGANEITPKLAGNGTGALLVWDSAGDISASLFTGSAFGGLIGVTADATPQSFPTVAAAPGGTYLVAYSDGAPATADITGAFVSAAGALGDAFTISAAAGRQYDPKASFDGTNYVVAWTNNNAGVDLYGTRVDAAGVVLDTRTEGMTTVGGVAISTAPEAQQLENLACNTGACVLVWQEGRNLATTSFDVYAQLLSTSPVLANNGGEIIVSAAGQAQTVPVVVGNGGGFFTAWQDARDTNIQTVFAANITSGGIIAQASGIPLVTGRNREGTPALGRAGITFGVFWADSRSFGTDIELMRFQGANKLDGTARAVSTAEFAQVSPAITSSSGNYFVVWNDSRSGVDRDIYGARVQDTGALLDAGGIAISTAAGDQLVPSIATNGTVSLVVWQDRRNNIDFDIFGSIVDNATGAAGANFPICATVGDQGRPNVAFDAKTGQFFVVWSDERNPDVNIFGARVTTAGAVSDPNGVQISTGAAGEFSPRVAFLNGVALVVWEDRRVDANGDIFGRRVTLDTGAIALVDANDFSISGAVAGEQNAPAVTALGASFLVVWTDGRNVGATGTDIFAQQVGTNASLNGPAFVVSNNPEDENAPALSDSLSDNIVRIAYNRSRPDLQTVRVETRLIATSSGTGQICSTDSQCSTGFCVDSRCCDTACGGNNATDCQACARSKTGQADGTCSFVPPTSFCRNYANTFCDIREYCTGSSPDCPPDLGKNQGLVCNTTTGAVCPSNAAPGPHGCP